MNVNEYHWPLTRIIEKYANLVERQGISLKILMNMIEINWKSLDNNEKQWKTIHINENQWNPLDINENKWKSMNVNEY